jgi:hypothetical protein
MNAKRLNEILDKHARWLCGWGGGERAIFINENLHRTNLARLNLTKAIFFGASLDGCDLTGTDLTDADLTGVTLSGAKLKNTKLPPYLICPEAGTFEAWKKLQDDVIARIRIPADAKRINAVGQRKCRAERVEVLELFKNGISILESACGLHQSDLVYAIGLTIEANKFNDDIREVCTNGIHFFMTRREAEEYI